MPRPARRALRRWRASSARHGGAAAAVALAAAMTGCTTQLYEGPPLSPAQIDYTALLSALGPAWAGLRATAPPPGATTDGAGYYAVLYRRDVTRPCTGWERLRYAADGGSATAAGTPASGCFEAEVLDIGGFEHLPVAVRLRAAERDGD